MVFLSHHRFLRHRLRILDTVGFLSHHRFLQHRPGYWLFSLLRNSNSGLFESSSLFSIVSGNWLFWYSSGYWIQLVFESSSLFKHSLRILVLFVFPQDFGFQIEADW